MLSLIYRETGRQTLVRSKEQPRPVQRVPPMQTQPPLPHGMNVILFCLTDSLNLIIADNCNLNVKLIDKFFQIAENSETPSGPSEHQSEPQSAKMLIFLQNGEQRLITFTLPKESCTLQEVLEQVFTKLMVITEIT
jgi:hypothetical protein